MSTSDSPSSGPTLLLGLLIGGAALLALGLSGPGPAPQPKSPAAPAPARPPDAPGPAPSALHGPLAPLYDFFHVADPCELPDRLGECSLEVLIATVPDPVDTVFDTSLDLYLGALQNALGIVRFVADRHYLPWDEKAAREQRRYRFEPGTVLFRDESLRRVGREQNLCRDRRERLLLVFLVGESPVTGIHKAAFAESVRLARMLCPELGELPVLSPCYSGSARSLIQALNAGKSSEKGLKFRVIAGGATNVNQEDFEKAAGTEFRSMRVHARVIKQELIHFVAHRNPGGVKIAWLSESNTAYGRIPVTPGDADGEGEPSGGGGVEDLAQVVEFPFPMHISRVRTAYGTRPRDSERGWLDLLLDTQRIPVPFEETEDGEDVVPVFGPQMTAVTAETVLAQILGTINREGIRYVGITATDARDRIFLAGLVRRHCPDTQLLMVGADILFAHPDVRDQLKGTLVGTEYPLYTDNQDWTSPRGAATRPPRRIQFASPAQQGFYNAVLALRRPPEDAELPLLEHAVPFAEAVPYREPGEDAHKPPVWISVVGNGRLWPLQCRGLDRALHHLKSEGVISEQQRERYAEYTYGGSGEAAGKAKGALREGRRPYPMATFGLDRPSLSLLVVLLVFGVGNVQFYFGRFRWSGARLFRLPSPAPPGAALIPQLRRGAARLLDLARSSAAARLPKEGMGEGAPGDQAPLVAPQVRYVLVCLLPLWVLLTALAVLACVPLVADCSFVTLAWDVPAQWLDVLLSVAAGSLVLAATGGALAWGIEATRAREEGRAVRGPLRRVGQASVVFLGGLVLVLLAVGWWFKPEDLGLLRSDVRLETLVLLGALLAGGGLLAVLADLSWAPGRAWAAKLFACLAAQMVLVIPVFAALLRVLGEGPEGVGEHHPVEALTNALLFYDRTIRHLFSGVSLFVMGALLALAFYAWGACQLRRLFRLAGSAPLAPWPESAGHPDGHAAQAYARITERIARNSQRLRDLLLSPGATLWAHAKGAFVIAVAVAAAWAVRMYWYALPPYEFRAAWLLWFGLVAFLFAWVLMLLQVVMTSNRLRKILKQLAFLPLKGAFGRVPEQVRGLLSRFLTGRRTRLSHCRIPVQYLGELARTAGEVAPRSGAGSAWEGFDPKGEYERAAAEFQKQLAGLAERADDEGAEDIAHYGKEATAYHAVQERLTGTSREIWKWLIPEWAERSAREAYPPDAEAERAAPAEGDARQRWVRTAEDFLAIQTVLYLSQEFNHARNLLGGLVLSSVLALLAVLSYPMQPHNLLISSFVVMTVTSAAVAVVTFVQMERDVIVSRLAGKSAGVLFDRHFLGTIALYVLPVVLILFARAMPETWNWVWSVISPLAQRAG